MANNAYGIRDVRVEQSAGMVLETLRARVQLSAGMVLRSTISGYGIRDVKGSS
jgi:hypothetical protein